MELAVLVQRVRVGDLAAYGEIVQATQTMVYGVSQRILRDPTIACDAVQETYLRAFRMLEQLHDPAAFPGWLRRIAVTTAQGMLRREQNSFVSGMDIPEVPVLDEEEDTWSQAQRLALAAALLTLDQDDRRLCDRYYHGGWSLARLAQDAQLTEPAMRKRLQRVRDKLRKEIEMKEQINISGENLPQNLPAKIIELLAKPKLVDLPENPVGHITELLRAQFLDYDFVELPEAVDLLKVKAALDYEIPANHPAYHYIDSTHILRNDLTIPMVMSSHNLGTPLHRIAAGSVYRSGNSVNAQHLEAFHQFEFCRMEEGLTAWNGLGDVLRVLTTLFPKEAIRLEQIHYALCQQAWQFYLVKEDHAVSIAGAALYTDQVVRYLGGDPSRHQAFGAGFGLERLAGLYYGITDLRTIESRRI